MLAAGLVQEVREILRQGVSADAPGLDGVGYREAVATLAGRLPAAELGEAIGAATRRYAKRQETWFRNQLRGPSSVVRSPGEAVWTLDATGSPESLAGVIAARWNEVTG
jgi:tRNA A37 N6-isopentenylltransferase MiaA